MTGRMILRAALMVLLVAGAGSAGTQPACAQSGCCKVCRAGKACGDSCIARDKRCTKAPGCACDG